MFSTGWVWSGLCSSSLQWVAMATQATSFTSYCLPRLFCFLRTVHNYIRWHNIVMDWQTVWHFKNNVIDNNIVLYLQISLYVAAAFELAHLTLYQQECGSPRLPLNCVFPDWVFTTTKNEICSDHMKCSEGKSTSSCPAGYNSPDVILGENCMSLSETSECNFSGFSVGFCITNLSLENSLLTFRLNAPVIIRAKVWWWLEHSVETSASYFPS